MQTTFRKSHTSGSPVISNYCHSATVMSVSQRVGTYHMKKLLILLTFAYVPSFAQIKHMVGLTANYVVSSTSNSSYLPSYQDNRGFFVAKADKTPYDGVGIGVLYRLKISHLYAQITPQYMTTGFGYTSPNNEKVTAKETSTNSFGYLSIPVKVGYFIVDRGLKLGVDAGISYNSNIEAKNKYNYDHMNNHVSTSSTLSANSSVVNALIGFNIGVEINERIKLELASQYSIGLTETITGHKLNSFSIGANVGFYLN